MVATSSEPQFSQDSSHIQRSPATTRSRVRCRCTAHALIDLEGAHNNAGWMPVLGLFERHHHAGRPAVYHLSLREALVKLLELVVERIDVALRLWRAPYTHA